jgi:DNA-3-methyladenine glycosylase I
MNTDLVTGPDGRQRCGWATGAVEYLGYHDDEWGRPIHNDDALYELFTLEAFQSGLSWLTILRKRPAFRTAFAQFSIEKVAAFDDADITRLLADAGIVRNRAKIEAAIVNARVAAELPGGLARLLWSFAPERRRARFTSFDQVPATTDESKAMARELRRRGFRFVGPTTAYATMQSAGLVDDHLAGCYVPAPD